MLRRNLQWMALVIGMVAAIGCGPEESLSEVGVLHQAVDTHLTYDADWAVKYATANYNRVYGSGKDDNPFSDYSSYTPGGNCTNFAGQVLIAGFIKSDSAKTVYGRRYDFDIDASGTGPYRWYFRSDGDRGPAWTGAPKLREYADNNKPAYRGLHFSFITNDTATTPLEVEKVVKGDFIFADWTGDGSIDHTMVVTEKKPGKTYNTIRLTFQTDNKTDRGLGDINVAYGRKALFYVYRPVDYNPAGL